MNELAFVDTNVFVRFFTQDDPIQSDAAENILKMAQRGELILIINDLVIAELAWVLRATYKMERAQIRKLLLSLLKMPNLLLRSANLTNHIVQAIDLSTLHNIDFADAYFAAWMVENEISTIFTFPTSRFVFLNYEKRPF